MARKATKPAQDMAALTAAVGGNPATIAASVATLTDPRMGETRGAYLRRMRQERGMTRAELADACSTDVDTITVAEDFAERMTDRANGLLVEKSPDLWTLAADALSLPEDAFLKVPVSIQPSAEPAPDGIILMRHADLTPSAFNSRKHFDPDELDMLAGTIAAQGLLQNLVARRVPDGPADIVAGERRWRAIGLLIERGQWDGAAANIPVLLRTMTEAEHRAAMIIENLSRKDPTPLEEARGFAELQATDPDLYTTRYIADTLGISPRMVQQRLKLLTSLVPEAVTAMEEGLLTVSMARALYQSPSRDMQRTVVAGIRAGDMRLQSVAGIRDFVTRGMVPVARARFPIQMYIDAVDGHDADQIVDFDNGARYLPNRDLFMHLQEAWAKDQCHRHVADGWDWALVQPTFAHWNYTATDVKQKGAGCVVVMNPTDGTITEHIGLLPTVKPAAAPPPRPAPVPPPQDVPSPSLPLTSPPATPAPTLKPDPLISQQQAHQHRTAMDFFRGRLISTLIQNPGDMMVLMIIDRGRPHNDSLFERVHSSDCVLPALLFHDDDGEPGPLFSAVAHVEVDDDERPPSDNTCVFHDRDAMGKALLELIAEGDPGSIAEAWAGLMADTIFLDSGTLHPVWRAYADLRGIPVPEHFRQQGDGQ